MINKKIYISGLLGVFLEYFDYTLYGFSAPFIASIFFPTEKPAIALILSWGIFALSFLVRPLGALILGHFADRLGRRKILMLTIMMMSVATIAMGLLPTYAQVGFFSPILLMLCRIFQGLAVSTEYSGCSTYLLEFSRRFRGLHSGIITSASGFGVFAASFVVLHFHHSWRAPFIFAGIIVGILGIYFRKNLVESPEFLVNQMRNKIQHFPFLHLIQRFSRRLLIGIVLSAYTGIAIIIIEIYLPSYAQTEFHMTKDHALHFATWVAFLEACGAIAFGYGSDFLGERKSVLLAGVLMLFGIFPAFYLFSQGEFFAAVILLATLVAAMDGPIAAILVSNFPAEVRYTGVSVSYNLGAAVFGGLSPAILEFLQLKWRVFYLPAWYLFAVTIGMLLGFMLLRRGQKSFQPSEIK